MQLTDNLIKLFESFTVEEADNVFNTILENCSEVLSPAPNTHPLKQ